MIAPGLTGVLAGHAKGLQRRWQKRAPKAYASVVGEKRCSAAIAAQMQWRAVPTGVRADGRFGGRRAV
ncbi:hypothetical protein BN2476_750105 [Paraburkholderia piptadeniae]|uniref:Uncharacterized protein n=1 Tax=Paraburkholderia piptadeniae TaxID=1701573 RepID=A0A1N7SS45_9BURK|nr:hypothetical protein BN2476_750105 [Paraburkholderia piptadeniae]